MPDTADHDLAQQAQPAPLAGRALPGGGYMSGFGNEFATEAVAGALPVGQNSPQRPPLGLYAESLSGTAFTAPRGQNRRSWLYPHPPLGRASALQPPRQRPAALGPVRGRRADAQSPALEPAAAARRTPGFRRRPGHHRRRGLSGGRGGVALHWCLANRSMVDRVFWDADGELLILPQEGGVRLVTEMGVLEIWPLEAAVIPRGVRFRAEIIGPALRAYVCENYGAMFRLPELGPIGANGLANPRDFLTPVADFEDVDRPTEMIQKFQGNLWATTLDHSPLDVVAWHGNYAPYKYDLTRFNTINTVSYDHPDPSIFTVLTSPSDTPGVANADFVIFPPRWQVAEDTFRPPWFHRNVMNEFMGLITGAYDAKAEGFRPGGASLHNCMASHGPDAATWTKASPPDAQPTEDRGHHGLMVETRWVLRPTRIALDTPLLQADYDAAWSGFPKQFPGS
ncbi:MAG: homogentisate 1,2-dioxygenase [Caulobacteraceae bacterium]